MVVPGLHDDVALVPSRNSSDSSRPSGTSILHYRPSVVLEDALIDFSCRSSAAYMLVAVAFLRLIFCEHPTGFLSARSYLEKSKS